LKYTNNVGAEKYFFANSKYSLYLCDLISKKLKQSMLNLGETLTKNHAKFPSNYMEISEIMLERERERERERDSQVILF
jgi:hypothetical protein